MTLFNLNLVTQIAPLQSRLRPAQAARSTTDLSPVSTKSDQDQAAYFLAMFFTFDF
jgi:hypothetical protein